MVTKKRELTGKNKLKDQARKYSVREGMFWSAKAAFGDRYISPFAIAINASDSLVAMLSSVAGLLGPLSQIAGSRLVEKYSRKKIMLKAIFTELLLWIPLIVISILFYKGILTFALPLFLIIVFGVYTITSSIGHPAWFSWMGDVVDKEYRGRYFSKRNLMLGVTSVVFALLASFFLDYFKKIDLIMVGFAILFFLALILEGLRLNTFKKQYEPKIRLKKGYYFSFFDFVRKAPRNNFGKFTLYRGFLASRTSIISPLVAVYLLRNLGFSYTTYMIIVMAGSVSSLLLVELWGKIADRYGNYKVIGMTSVLIPVIPILWILSDSPLYLIFIPQLISGLAWGGFDLASGNFIYDNVSQPKRGVAVSYFNMIIGIGIFLGAGLGALLIDVIKISSVQPIILIFIISGVARMLVVFFGISQIKEVRKTKKFRGFGSMKDLISKQIKPTFNEEFNQIIHLKKYFSEK